MTATKTPVWRRHGPSRASYGPFLVTRVLSAGGRYRYVIALGLLQAQANSWQAARAWLKKNAPPILKALDPGTGIE